MTSTLSQRLLYFSPAGSGGLADYARAQAHALGSLGMEVELLTTPGFPVREGDAFHVRPDLERKTPPRFRPLARLASASRILRDYRQLADRLEAGRYHHVLLGAYAEYLAPCWAPRLRRQAQKGVVFGAVVHDPVRDYVVGPPGWHRRSIASAYSFLREAFVHEPIVLDTGRLLPHLRTTVIPHGPYDFPRSTQTRDRFRQEAGIPLGAEVWLAFGHVRDGKNLDLVLRALARFPNAFLIVAGREQSGGQKPVSFYRELAEQADVGSRCLWLNHFIPAGDVGNLFEASDLILLTYSRDFRSASGVLNAAISFRKPCIASSGQGNLKTVLTQYDLGTWVEPDDLDALVEGLHRGKISPPRPRWEAYESDNSWKCNAERVSECLFGPAVLTPSL